jgi:excisionase family DNA binding protein
METTALEKLYSTQEVAQQLGLGIDWVRRVFRKRKGVVRIGGRNMRIPESLLLEVIREYGYTGKSTNGNDSKKHRGDRARS